MSALELQAKKDFPTIDTITCVENLLATASKTEIISLNNPLLKSTELDFDIKGKLNDTQKKIQWTLYQLSKVVTDGKNLPLLSENPLDLEVHQGIPTSFRVELIGR